ncbi:MAG TPA: M3 family oligoendopeptidase [bacterium]|nr:M3 family oligoendopeptidase [bacterium]
MTNLKSLPEKATEMLGWSWPQFETYYSELAKRKLTQVTLEDFLDDWTRFHDRLDEVGTRLSIAKDVNTADTEAERKFNRFLEEIYPKSQEAEQKLKTRFLNSGLQQKGFERPLRRMQADAAIFREANLPLQVEDAKLGTEYGKITGSQTVEWDGQEITVTQLRPVLMETDRARREKAWRLSAERQLKDRDKLNDLWQKFLKLRLQMSANAGFADYRSFRWQEMYRFDYTPQNCRQFRLAIEKAVVPAAARIYERRAKQLGLAALKPWDQDVDPLGRAPLAPFKNGDEFKAGVHSILTRVDPHVGGYFRTMMNEGTLDLENRKNKAPGGYCATYDAAKLPFIFMNAVGLHGDVMTLIHESGHATHSFETRRLPWFQQRHAGLEFAEVASMGMELLATPYLAKSKGGFYSEEEAERALTENLEKDVQFWPYMAVVDGFQQWVYENPQAAMEPANCDRQWTELWNRLMTGVDWSGFEDVVATGWHRKLHIFLAPFYYVEYGLAQLGACQVWANAQKDEAAAVASYRKALALGGTQSLPELYAAAGAKFAFDSETLGAVIGLIEGRLAAA